MPQSFIDEVFQLSLCNTYSEKINGKKHVWSVDELIDQSSDLVPYMITIDDLYLPREDIWFCGGRSPYSYFVSHMQRAFHADLDIPIIVSAEMRVMDGYHRLAQAITLGHVDVFGKRFKVTPKARKIIDL